MMLITGILLHLIFADRTEAESPHRIFNLLEQMSEQGRNNSYVQLFLESDASSDARSVANDIENLWNTGNYELAIKECGKLALLTNINETAIGISWEKPIQTETPFWAQDIRIGNRDSIYAVAFDIHRATNNLFAVLLYKSGTYSGWSVNYSTNGGYTWNETYYLSATYSIRSLSASIVANHCYVCYSRPSAQNQAYLYRFRAVDAQRDTFSNGAWYSEVFSVSSPDTIDELVLLGDQDDSNMRLYCTSIINDGRIRFFWDDPQAISWTEIQTGITDADRGLDISKNVGYKHYWMLISYINNVNNLRIYGLGYGLNNQCAIGR